MAARTAGIAAQRLHRQRLLKPSFRSPGEVVRFFGAVQSQDFLGSLYGVGLRMAKATERSVEQAIAEKAVIRTWPMRGTIHMVPPEDARWMLKLMARRVTVHMKKYYERIGLTPDLFRKSGKTIERALRGGKVLTRGELYEALEPAGIKNGPDLRGLQVLDYWAMHGLICFGPRRVAQATFTLLDEWVPEGAMLEGEEALAELARRYFLSHGPATLQDFAWWTGLSMGEARTGLKGADSQLVLQKVNGGEYWGPEPQAVRMSSPDVHMLPPYDEFTVAYKDRSAIGPAGALKATGYALSPAVILDGQMAGTWKRTRDKAAVSVSFDMIAPLKTKERDALVEAAERYGKFLGLPVKVEARSLK